MAQQIGGLTVQQDPRYAKGKSGTDPNRQGIGNWIGDRLPFDPTPGFNVTNPFNNNKPAPASQKKEDSPQGQVQSFATDTPYTPPSTSQNGRSSSDVSAADLAMFDAGISTANNTLGLLDQQQNVGFGNINSGYNSALSRLLGSKNAAEQQYGTTRTRAQQDNIDARSQIDASVGRNANALQRLLGSRGAGNSSAAQIAAPYAAALQGTQQRMGVEKDYSRNMQDLDANYNSFNTEWGQSREDLDRQKFQQEQALKSSIAEKRSGLLQTLADLNARKAAARGGSSAAALAAAQPYLNQVNSLQGEITNLGQQYANPISVNAPQYVNPELAQYQYDTGLNAGVENTSALTDTVSPAYATLLGLNRRREQQSIGF